MMKLLFGKRNLFAIIVVLLTLLLHVPGGPAAAQIEKQKGISFTAWSQGLYGTPKADLSMQNLKATGANWIAVMVTQFQPDLGSTTIRRTDGTPTDAEVIATIQKAHELGLKVMLKPHIDLDTYWIWRGNIGDGYTEAQWTAWFDSYRQFIYHYAEIAEAYDVEQFAVGTELWKTEWRDAQWRTTVSGVRSRYSGPITYAANHSGPEMNMTWWDAVDFIGVDAYYPLAEVNNPTQAQLIEAWAPIVSDLEYLYDQWGKPIIFTEVGYRSVNGAAQQPWAWDEGGVLDLQEQVDLYEALMTALYNKPWFAGLYVWDWTYEPFQGGVCDVDFTVYDKPAENVLRRWFGASERQISTFPAVDEGVSRAIYSDALASGWQNWSWSSTINLAATDQVHSGTKSISVTASPWGALKLHYDAGIATGPYYFVEFYVRTDSAATELYVRPYGQNDAQLDSRALADCRYTSNAALAPNTWTRVRVPLEHMGAKATTIYDIAIQAGDAGGKFWVDGLRLVGATGSSDNSPSISGFAPTSGAAGTSVTINGANLSGATSVKFNGAAASITSNTATQIVAVVPAGATTGKVSVTTPNGTVTSADNFTVSGSAPTISSLSPAGGPVGSDVVISGTNLNGATTVSFNGAAASFSAVSATKLLATVPSGATTGKVSVTTPNGTATGATNFTVFSPPTISGFSPAAAAPTVSITINGTNLTGAWSVSFNGAAATPTSVTATSVVVAVPAGATTGKVSVTTPGGTVTSAADFTVLPPLPTVISLSPTSGPAGTNVLINGTNFVNVTGVAFNGAAAGTFSVLSPTSIRATVPTGATTGKVSVTTQSGTASSPSDFVVPLPPKISKISPTAGSVGTTVTITGTNLTGATSVKFNGVAAAITSATATQIRAVVPVGATSGKISVTTPGGTALSVKTFTVR